MNKLIIAAALVLAGNAYAEDHGKAAAKTTTPPPAATATATTTAPDAHKHTGPMTEVDATKACTEAKATDMKACVAEKTGKAKKAM